MARPVSFFFKYAGVMAIPVYTAFTLASHFLGRGLSPLKYWLSDYGNPLINPDGAVFYATGCIITALLLAVFYAGMYRWYRREREARKFNISFAVAQAGGLIGSAFLILTVVFPLGTQTELHSVFSRANMIAMDFFLTFTATGLLMNRGIHKGIGLFGFLAAGFNIVATNAFSDFYIGQKIYFLMFMVYLVLLTRHDERIRAGQPLVAQASKNAE